MIHPSKISTQKCFQSGPALANTGPAYGYLTSYCFFPD